MFVACLCLVSEMVFLDVIAEKKSLPPILSSMYDAYALNVQNFSLAIS